jgi:O-antigen biosynthesis protein WbqP
MLKRICDLLLALLAICVLAVPMIFIAICVRFTSPGPILYWSKRFGKDNILFSMPKFRTMKVSTPEVATHMLANPNFYLTPIGSMLRKSSLDELPQLWSILNGDMSFIGPRPALFNQIDLVQLRAQNGVDSLVPGLTGWAQINGRDELDIQTKVVLDREYLERKSFIFDLKILAMTFVKVIFRHSVSH